MTPQEKHLSSLSLTGNAANLAIGLQEFLENFQQIKNFTFERGWRETKIYQKIAISFAPWTNGVAETSNKKIIKIFRILGSEMRIYEEEWPNYVGLIMHA